MCDIEDIVVVVYKWDQFRYRIREKLEKHFGVKIEVIELPSKCNSQPETIKEVIKILQINDCFFVKDVDCCFNFNIEKKEYNYVCVSSLMDFNMVNPQNKCYTKIDHENNIIDIKEKIIVSELFVAGGYFFNSANNFMLRLAELNKEKKEWENEPKLSDIIGLGVLAGETWRIEKINDYQDYGGV